MPSLMHSMSPRAGAAAGAMVLVAGLALSATTTNGASASAAPSTPHGTQAPKGAVRVVVGQTTATSYGQCSPTNLTALVSISAGTPSYDIPGAGVLTSVSTRGNVIGGSFRAVVYSKPGPDRDLVALSPVLTIAPNVLNTFPVRLPVPANSTLGYNTASDGSGCSLLGMSPDDWMVMNIVDPGVFSTFYDYAIVDKARPNVSAVWESDDDGDGYGDVSQDACPQSALSHVRLPRAGDDDIKQPRKSSTRRRSSSKFAASIPGRRRSSAAGRQRPRDRAPRPTSARLGLGRHTLLVSAVSPAGITDPTPGEGGVHDQAETDGTERRHDEPLDHRALLGRVPARAR